MAALTDKVHIQKSKQLLYEGRRFLYQELERMGIRFIPCQANFIFIDFGKDIGEISQGFLREGMIIRPGRVWGYPTCDRVTIGRMTDNRRFIKALKKIYGH